MEKFKTFAVKVMGMTDDETAALLDADGNITEDAFDVLARKDRDRFVRLNDAHREELTQKFNDGHAKAKKEERKKYEDEIRDTFGVDSKAMGIDLIKDVLAQGSKDDVKRHPDYIALERKLQSEYIPKEDYEVVKGEFDSFKTKVERDTVMSRVKQDGRSLFHAMNPVLSKDSKRRMNQEGEFLSKLESFNYQLQDDGNHLVLDSNGKRVTNENMNPVSFQDFVKEKTLAYFDVMDQQPAGNSSTSTSATTSKTRYENSAAFFKAWNNESDPAKASKMYEDAKQQGLI